MWSQQTDDCRITATANDRIITHERNIQEKESNAPKRNETSSLALLNTTSSTGLLKETNPVDERKPVHTRDNCKLFLAYEQNEDGKPVPKYLHHHSGDPELKAKCSTTNNKRDVFKGFYNCPDNCDIPVAIVKTLLRSEQEKKGIGREFRILKELEVQENFIRYFAHEMDLDFVYVATEPCLCSVADLLDTPLEMKIPMKQEILKELPAKEILSQATRGLDYLHKNHFVHRNIKPNNFLIKKVNSENACRFAVKITDFRLTRKYDPDNDSKLSGSAASEGWEAPESRDVEKDLSTKLDVFILGCFYHYVLTAPPMTNRVSEGKPSHPFGDNEAQRVRNIRDSKYSVYEDTLKFEPKNKDKKEVTSEVTKLIKRMLKFKEEERPTLQEVLDSSYFKPSEDYKLYEDYKSPGLCVIFNQQVFQDERKNREGSDKDRDALKNTFTELGFEIKVHENLASFDLKSEINDLAKRKFNDYGCLVVCLLSHGIENAILCYDGRYVKINELKYEFSLNNCPSLYGKPKIFIVQACQGQLSQSKKDIIPHTTTLSSFFSDLFFFPKRVYQNLTDQLHPASVVQSTEKEIDFTNQEEKLKEVSKILEDAPRNPPLMDFITIKATLPGFVSYRLSVNDKNGQGQKDRQIGSSFIQALCETLSEEYFEKEEKGRKHLELEGLLRKVQLKINAFSERTEDDRWQTMQWEACLRKYIRFRGCETKDINVEFSNQKEDYHFILKD